MKSVFIVNRSNYYRYFSRIIESLAVQNFTVEIWSNSSQEIIDPPFGKKISEKLNFSSFHNEEDLSNKIKETKNTNLFFSLHPFPGKLDDEIFKKINNKWVLIMHGLDSYLELRDWHINHQKKYLDIEYHRHFLAYSSYIHQIGLNWLKDYRKEGSGVNCEFLSSKKTSVHFSEAPFIEKTNYKLDPLNIKERYSIDPKKKVLVYLPFPYSGGRYDEPLANALHTAFSGINHIWKLKLPESVFSKVIQLMHTTARKIKNFFLILRFPESRRIYLNKYNEKAVIEKIREFCDANNLLFIVKAREKFSILGDLHNKADLIISEDLRQNPSTFQELSIISDLTIGYTSTAVLESIFYKTPFINISFPKEYNGYGDYSYEMHSPRKGFIYNYPGSVTNYSCEDFISDFAGSKLSHFELNKESEKEYRQRFIGEEFLFDEEDFINKIKNIN